MKLNSKMTAIAKTVPKYKELSGLEKDVTLMLSQQRSDVNITKLCKLLQLSQPLASRILSDLEEDGVILKIKNDRNRKEKFLSLTSLGQEIAEGLKNKDNKHALIIFL